MNQCGLCAVFATTMDTSMKGSMIAIEIPANADFFFFYTQNFKLPGIFFFQLSKQICTSMFNLYIWYLNVPLS